MLPKPSLLYKATIKKLWTKLHPTR